MIVGTRQQLEKVNIAGSPYGWWYMSKPCHECKNSQIDSDLNLKEHINKTCKTVYFHLHKVQGSSLFRTIQINTEWDDL